MISRRNRFCDFGHIIFLYHYSHQILVYFAVGNLFYFTVSTPSSTEGGTPQALGATDWNLYLVVHRSGSKPLKHPHPKSWKRQISQIHAASYPPCPKLHSALWSDSRIFRFLLLWFSQTCHCHVFSESFSFPKGNEINFSNSKKKYWKISIFCKKETAGYP